MPHWAGHALTQSISNVQFAMSQFRDLPPAVRLDVWLDVACLFKTRSEAKRACEGGKVEVNGERAKPHRMVKEGDRVRITRPFGRHQEVEVLGVIDEHVTKSDARTLYQDLTPKPTPEEIEVWRAERVYRAAAAAAGSDPRKRRQIRKEKERERE
jgi:ribosome-associated heat shock protein Hsp15